VTGEGHEGEATVRVSDKYAPTVSCSGVENSQAMQSGPLVGLKGGFAGGVPLKVGRLKDSCAFLESIPLHRSVLENANTSASVRKSRPVDEPAKHNTTRS
jgi:hypothetical protein